MHDMGCLLKMKLEPDHIFYNMGQIYSMAMKVHNRETYVDYFYKYFTLKLHHNDIYASHDFLDIYGVGQIYQRKKTIGQHN